MLRFPTDFSVSWHSSCWAKMQNLLCSPQGYVLINMFVKRKKSSKPGHTSHTPPKITQNGSTKKKLACFRGSVIPDSLGSQCHHEELKINHISHIMEAERNNIIMSGSYICEAVQQVSLLFSYQIWCLLVQGQFFPTSSTSNQIGQF